MSTNTVASNETTGPTVEALYEKVESLESELTDTQERLSEAESTIEEQSSTIESLQEQLRETTTTVEDHDGRLDDHDARMDGLSAAKDYNRERIEDVEDRLEDEKGGCGADKSGSTELYQPQTPLEQITTLPEHVAAKELTSNPERARFIANDIRDYGDKRLGEWVLSSGDIRKVLAVKEGQSIHWQTVHRVIECLDDLGGDDTTVKDKHGTIVCFDPSAVEKYNRTRQNDDTLTPVVSGGPGEV